MLYISWTEKRGSSTNIPDETSRSGKSLHNLLTINISRTLSMTTIKARSHDAMCDRDLLYQEMECCLRFSDFVHMVRFFLFVTAFFYYIRTWNVS